MIWDLKKIRRSPQECIFIKHWRRWWSLFLEKLKLQTYPSSYTCCVQTIPRNELSRVLYFLINPVLLFGVTRLMFGLNERTGKFRRGTIQGGVSTPSTSAALFCFKLDFLINLIFHLKLLTLLHLFLFPSVTTPPISVPGLSLRDQTLLLLWSDSSFSIMFSSLTQTMFSQEGHDVSYVIRLGLLIYEKDKALPPWGRDLWCDSLLSGNQHSLLSCKYSR